ncbi:fluoride efflux transporter CrcB [Amaricoccus macauensis]|uniref:fluoride efflux transporter CrcB n=1 Tax=Amaricoccus macauensis TaxID=57001 RepID=UPI003C7B9082
MPIALQVALGGAIGATCRYLLAGAITRRLGAGFPFGTLSVNVIGSLIMGVALVFILRRTELGLNHLAPFFMTGVLGGFTTFSAFSLETVLLFERGRADLAAAYIIGSVILAVGAFVLPLVLLKGWIVS